MLHIGMKTKREKDIRMSQTVFEYFLGATVCKTVRPMLSDRCLSVCPVCPVLSLTLVGVLWPNGLTDQGETW